MNQEKIDGKSKPLALAKSFAKNAEIWLYVVVGEKSVWRNVQSRKCPFGELPVRWNVCRGSVRRESVSRGFVLGEVSVGELYCRETVLVTLYLFIYFINLICYLQSIKE